LRAIYGDEVSFTLISFHAHPDDEAIYTGGTLARAAAEGHRVVLAVATDGSAGLADSRHGKGAELSRQRMRELDAAAAVLGCARVVPLGFKDSGWRTQPPPGAFSTLPPQAAAEPLTALLREERADALTTYDPVGGYGHPDHKQVHAVGAAAAAAVGTPLVLQATVDRSLIRPVARLIAAVPRLLPEVRSADYVDAYTAHEDITHRVDVRGYADQKRRALLAHYSQATSDKGIRTAALLLRLPTWVFGRALGREWFVEQGRVPGAAPLDDIFTSLRPGSA
jgi:LmbE family N-acetylglucosaminyl deacetylase